MDSLSMSIQNIKHFLPLEITPRLYSAATDLQKLRILVDILA